MSALGEALGALGRDLQSCGVPHALVGGLAVSVRTEPRFTRDIDVVAAVAAEEIDRLGRHLVERGHRIESILADASGALVAGLRLRGHGVREDVLLACSGLEAETCASAEPIEVLPGVVVPVATTPHLLVLELIAIAERSRTQDRADVEALIDAATDDERAAVEALLPRVRSAHGTPPERLVQLWRGVSRG
ncbi:MAG: nucleotidyl transferase AbiEii/AbiGii toxin family protein [Deltaproteobacteria bacterium]|nr:nucleotidyl transferase AbiEii/AbiGii toxin family protein [Deltaproteobacteria bacterium]